jgi:cyclophilin family peptidyl-prolyl cis-trans isomerase
VGAGAFTIKRTNGGAVLASAPFTVPAPQVTMAFDNHAGVAGSIVVTLAPDKTPITVNNFLSYVQSGFYVGTVFHRVSPGFVVQGGGYVAPFDSLTQTLKPTGAPIPLEVGKGLSNTQWSISMARAKDPDTASATTQFFINLVDNSGYLDPGVTGGYAVFGTVSGSASDVTAIAGAPCVSIRLVLASTDCAPTPNIVITSAAQTR